MGTRNKKQIQQHYYNKIAGHKTVKWTAKDNRKFEEAYKLYGKNYAKIREHIKTKDLTQVKCKVTTLARMYKKNPK